MTDVEPRVRFDVLATIAEMARELADAEELDVVLQRGVDLAQVHLAGCDGASLMVVRKGGAVTTPASSSELARAADRCQHATGEGPCLEAIFDERTAALDDVESDGAWPRFRSALRDLGVRSVFSLRVFARDDTLGALNLYSFTPRAFDEEARLFAQILASHLAVSLKAAITEAGLRAALETRDVIGQAKGVLMDREHLTAEAAFERLRDLSVQQRRSVRDLAEEIAATGVIPDGA